MQLFAAILFFYVFGLGAVLMTYYVVKTVKELIQVSREQHNQAVKLLPEEEQDSVKLHISGGLIEVNRLSDEQEQS